MCENVQRRGERVTSNQKKIIVEFMEDNLEFARGRLLGLEGKITANNMWQVLCQQLNCNGPEKTVAKWQRAWTDIKIKVRRKAIRRKAGGESPDDITLDDIDERIVQIMSETAVYGLLDFEEPIGIAMPGTSHIKHQVARRKRVSKATASCLKSNDRLPAKRQEIQQWNQIVDEEERLAVSDQRTNQFNPLASPALEISSDSASTTTPQVTWSRRSAGVEAVDELREFTRQGTQALQEFGSELKNLNQNVSKLLSQNDEMMTQGKQTNNILLRIAQALERQGTE